MILISPIQIDEMISKAASEKAEISENLRITHVLKKVNELQNSSQEADTVNLLIWLIHLMTEFQKAPSIQDRQVAKAEKVAQAVIDLLAHHRDNEGLQRLRTNYQIAISKIRQRQGDHWRATWELERAFQLGPDRPVGGIGNKLLGEGFRLLRLGLATVALRRFEKAAQKLDDEMLLRAKLAIAKTLRLMDNFAEAKKILSELKLVSDLPKAFADEIVWELGCLDMSEAGSCGKVLSLTLANSSHHQASYLAEGISWSYAFGDEVWQKRLPSVRYAKSKKELEFSSNGHIVDALSSLETCYQSNISESRRIDMIAEAITTRAMIHGIDREQLFLAAAARWLSEIGQNRLAAIVLSQYRSNSWRLTDAKNGDHMRVTKDLSQKPWFKDFL